MGLINRAVLFSLILIVPALADMDAPRWYQFLNFGVRFENIAEFPDLVFINDDVDGMGEETYSVLKPENYDNPLQVLWIKRKDYSPKHLNLLLQKEHSTTALYKPFKYYQSYLSKYYLTMKTVTAISDPLKKITEIFHISRKNNGEPTIESRALLFEFKGEKKVEIPSKRIDAKNPLFWLKPIHSFQFTGMESFPNSKLVVIEARAYHDSHATPEWSGDNVANIEKGRVYRPAGDSVFYLVYALPKLFSLEKRDWVVKISETPSEDIVYLGGFFSSKKAANAITKIEIRGENGVPKRLVAGRHVSLFQEEAPKAETVSDPVVPRRDQASTEQLPRNPDKRLFLGIPFGAAVAIGLILWLRKRRKPTL